MEKKIKVVKLKTFHNQNTQAKGTKVKPMILGKSDEITAILKMAQTAASGGEVDIVNSFAVPSSLFSADWSTRVAGMKSTLVTAFKEETEVNSVPHLPEELCKTVVVVDAIFAVRHWSFHKSETFGITER